MHKFILYKYTILVNNEFVETGDRLKVGASTQVTCMDKPRACFHPCLYPNLYE